MSPGVGIRCHSVSHNGYRCEGDEGHWGPGNPHWATVGGGRALRWGVIETGCADNRCNRPPNHEGAHNDGRGTSWYEVDDDQEELPL